MKGPRNTLYYPEGISVPETPQPDKDPQPWTKTNVVGQAVPGSGTSPGFVGFGANAGCAGPRHRNGPRGSAAEEYSHVQPGP